MNGAGWFLIGVFVGGFGTYWFFILYAKYMAQHLKDQAINTALSKWGVKN